MFTNPNLLVYKMTRIEITTAAATYEQNYVSNSADSSFATMSVSVPQLKYDSFYRLKNGLKKYTAQP